MNALDPNNFDFSEYPNAAGHRGVDTSIEAADKITPKLGRLQALVLGAIVAAGERGMTADEVSDALGLDRWSCQPRTSELRTKLKIRDSGQRRKNATGKRAIVWIDASLPETAPEAEAA